MVSRAKMNLADDPETVASYPDINTTYYSHQNYIALNIGSMIREESPEKALSVAAKASGIAVSRPGAAPSIPELSEVLEG
ncbi:hypothetical protein UYO_0070 [Lachnospiraceae bacterium JC7]|nr:hypothetical protein UYO_0070 [Lachnospiraceae bacterium JC7]